MIFNKKNSIFVYKEHDDLASPIDERLLAIDRLKNYNGRNPYLLGLQFSVIQKSKTGDLTPFSIEYINKNYNREPKPINKMAILADWLADKKKIEWNIDFVPSKIKITWFLGETESFFHVFAQYRQSVEACEMFLPKNGILTNFLIEDFHNVQVDFNRYDALLERTVPGRKVKDHQKEAVQFLLSRKKCILADDMGLGKTSELIIAAIEGNFDSVLIICPASLKTGWQEELTYYVPQRDVTIIEGFSNLNKSELESKLGYGIGKSGKKKEELLDEIKERGKWADNRFVIINYDILDDVFELTKARKEEKIQAALANSPMYQYIAGKKSLIIIDEAHELSNTTSQQYKIIKSLLTNGKPHSVYLATGTPVTNNPENYYALLALLNDPIAQDYEAYMQRYCKVIHIPINKYEKDKRDRIQNAFLYRHNKHSWNELNPEEKKQLQEEILKKVRTRIRPVDGKNLEELRMRTSHLYLRRVKTDLKDEEGNDAIPPKHIHKNVYELDAIQLMEYNRLWDEYETAKKNEDPSKELDKELLEGGLYRRYLSNIMVPYTIDLANRCIAKGEKVVICCCFDEELYKLRDYYGDRCVIYNGKMDRKQKDEAKDKFINDPNVMVFIGNIEAAGVGITLVVSRVMIFNNISWVPGLNLQMEDRVSRIGQTRETHIFYQTFNGTQYDKMLQATDTKSNIINQIIKKESEK